MTPLKSEEPVLNSLMDSAGPLIPLCQAAVSSAACGSSVRRLVASAHPVFIHENTSPTKAT